MGDQIGVAVDGTLYYLDKPQFDWLLASDMPATKRISLIADMCRLNALYMIARAGSGHIGSSFSSMEIMCWVMLEELSDGDVFFSSKGHDAPAYYSVLMAKGLTPFKKLHVLRRIGGLPGHPDVNTPGIITNTGSLGMGISKAKGMILANRQQGKKGRIVVMTGDGELQEGQFWESLISAANFGLHELTVIIDHNKLQSDTFVKNVSDLGDLESKLKAFGWRVERVDGNDVDAIAKTLSSLKGETRPQIIIADTIKGKGVSFMEHTSLDSDVAMYRFHSGAPDSINYQRAAQEILDRLKENAPQLQCESITRDPAPTPPADAQRLIPAYSKALIEQAAKHKHLVALDADLILDTGLIPFREQFPDRFIECGIAEQDMVSMAGGMALNGALPVVHSFACFLSARPNEQIYNNATEHTKIIYVGSLAGVVPGGPGHSHQAVRDIASLSAIPGLTLMEPSCEAEVGMLLDWCVNTNTKSSYMRLMSLPWQIPYTLPASYKAQLGRGCMLHDGIDAAIIGYGPVLLSNAYAAAKESNARLINLPWLNVVDMEWLKQELRGIKKLLLLDNHYTQNAQADHIIQALASAGISGINIKKLGVTDVPPSGTNPEVLEAVGLTTAHISRALAA